MTVHLTGRVALRLWLLVLCTALPGTALARDAEHCSQVRLGTVGWLDAGAAVWIASALLHGLGYEPGVQKLSEATIFASMKNGDLDATLEIMVPTMGDALKPYMLDNSVELVNQNLAGTKYTLAVNRHARALGITRFDQLHEHADALSRRIHGVEPGADGNLLIHGMINEDRYGLGGFHLVESSEGELVQAIAAANQEGRPMVFLAFEPHPMNVRFDLTYLAGGEAVFGPAFGGADVYTGIRPALLTECPNLARLLTRLTFTLPMINEVMTAILEFNARPLVAAVAWMRQQPVVLDAWLDGVDALDGGNGRATVRAFIGLP